MVKVRQPILIVMYRARFLMQVILRETELFVLEMCCTLGLCLSVLLLEVCRFSEDTFPSSRCVPFLPLNCFDSVFH